MKTMLFHVVFFLALGVLVTWASADAPATVHETTLMESGQKTLEVSTDELRKILAEKSATVFDARPLMEYSMSHIPGAVNVSEKPGVPISQYVSDVAEVGRVVGNNKSAPIVLYCNGPFLRQKQTTVRGIVGCRVYERAAISAGYSRVASTGRCH